jgi:hypothetical protein
MLTRTSEIDDIAPDVSVFPDARDPETGGRQLEQLGFEVVSSESLGCAGRKAAKLVARGARRVFAIDVERARALEWSSSLGTWSVLDPSAHIEDRALEVPLPIGALLLAAKADDAVARTLVAKHNPVIWPKASPAVGPSRARDARRAWCLAGQRRARSGQPGAGNEMRKALAAHPTARSAGASYRALRARECGSATRTRALQFAGSPGPPCTQAMSGA